MIRLRFIFVLTCVGMLIVGAGCSTGSYYSKDRLKNPSRAGLLDRDLPTDFKWPLTAMTVTSGFGQRGSKFHEGIDLRAQLGTPIHAAKSGVVIYSDRKIRGYGQMVVIRHNDGLATIYAHNSKNLARKGDRVSQGQVIALVGATGHAHGTHLHFEVRRGLAAINPLRILRSSRAPTILTASKLAPFRSTTARFDKKRTLKPS